ncbi:MAG: hypothetical protein Q7T16_04555 [Candidatus Burarchaeum sp.]|nr:hypothetical protein [Candidatus Burarchaeum sp.]MDO8339899.1 hypothetical protein [Candidatus Burarchaeum sp.]
MTDEDIVAALDLLNQRDFKGVLDRLTAQGINLQTYSEFAKMAEHHRDGLNRDFYSDAQALMELKAAINKEMALFRNHDTRGVYSKLFMSVESYMEQSERTMATFAKYHALTGLVVSTYYDAVRKAYTDIDWEKEEKAKLAQHMANSDAMMQSLAKKNVLSIDEIRAQAKAQLAQLEKTELEMMSKIEGKTDRIDELRIYNFIKEYVEVEDHAPHTQEIKNGSKMSPNRVVEILKRLVARGNLIATNTSSGAVEYTLGSKSILTTEEGSEN